MLMSVDEAREKWEHRFWEAYRNFKDSFPPDPSGLMAVYRGIEEDGFSVQIVESARDSDMKGLIFRELPSLTFFELNCMSGLKRRRVRVTLEVVANLVVGGEDAEDRKDAVRMMIEDHLADPKPLAILENSISSVAVRRIEEEA